MVGEQALKKAFAAYRPEQDKEPSYMPRLIQSQTQRDLEWFFDDWVYRDRGLPDFKVESAFSRKTANDAYVLTITVDNLGSAGAEVPLTVRICRRRNREAASGAREEQSGDSGGNFRRTARDCGE